MLDDVLAAFAPLASVKKRHLLFAPTVVSFTSAVGGVEEGDDRGGLTAELCRVPRVLTTSLTVLRFDHTHTCRPAC
jgi:hypothetical protein